MLSSQPDIPKAAHATETEKRLARRIRNQRRRLAQLEKFEWDWCVFWKRRALGYRRQLMDAGIEPRGVWSAAYKRPHNGS